MEDNAQGWAYQLELEHRRYEEEMINEKIIKKTIDDLSSSLVGATISVLKEHSGKTTICDVQAIILASIEIYLAFIFDQIVLKGAISEHRQQYAKETIEFLAKEVLAALSKTNEKENSEDISINI